MELVIYVHLVSFTFYLQDGKPASHEQCQATNSADQRTARQPEVWLLLHLMEQNIKPLLETPTYVCRHVKLVSLISALM